MRGGRGKERGRKGRRGWRGMEMEGREIWGEKESD